MSAVLRPTLLILALVPCFSISTASMALEMRGDGRLAGGFELGFDANYSSKTLGYSPDLASPAKLTGATFKTPTAIAIPKISSVRKPAAYSTSYGLSSYSLPGRRMASSSFGLNYNFPAFAMKPYSTTPTIAVQPTVTPKTTTSSSSITSSSSKGTHSIRITVEPPQLDFDLDAKEPLLGSGAAPASLSLTFSGAGTGEVSPTVATRGAETLLAGCTDDCEGKGEDVSEPGTLLFLGFGLAGLVAVRRRNHLRQA